ncbi:MAG: serine hydrolase domain-containing protein [Gemmatimonadales bacterium]|jgi:CubicO group peptidase (beta-lactamase class C family)
MQPMRTLVAPFLASLALSLQLSAQELPVAAPEQVGFSSERIGRLDTVVQQYVDEGKIAGVVALIARRGQLVHLRGYGHADIEGGTPMMPDAIFRIASMTKAVTSVAVMMLVEEGRLSLYDPLSRYMPAFSSTTVAVATEDASATSRGYTVVEAERPITVRDLLTHTSGINYGTGMVEAEYRQAGLYYWYFADEEEPIGASIERLAGLPFVAQPGERWVYGFSTDVLGYLVEVLSGMTLAEFFQSRIFDPLGMRDTHFYLPTAKRNRLAAVYQATEDGRIVRAPDEGMGQGAYVEGPRLSYSGGAGLLSTAEDYGRFLQMLLNGGELNGTRLLSPKTVELMTANHVGDLYANGNLGFGLGFEVVEDVGRAGRVGSEGAYGWGGAYYTLYWVDPAEELVAVFMAQLLPSRGLDLQGKFRTLVYGAIVESLDPTQSTGACGPAR